MANPLEALETAAKGAVVGTVEWAFGASRRGPKYGKKSDPVLATQPMDVLRRAAYDNVFETLFQNAESQPYVKPDKTLKNVIWKLSFHMFPKGTTFSISNTSANDLLQDLLKETKFQLKTEDIVTEAALMDYCALRSVYDDTLGRWLFEVKQKEYLVIETVDGVQDEYIAIGLEYPIEKPGKKNKMQRFWRKERWTKDEYQTWPDKPEDTNGKPVFKLEDMNPPEQHFYGEIPFTPIPHLFVKGCQGKGIVGPEEILTAKSLIRLRQKRHFGHLKYMDPNPVRKNHRNPEDPVDLGIGNPIDLQQADENAPVDLTLLEFQGMPDSVKDEFYDDVKIIFEAAGLKPPQKDDAMKVGTAAAGVALRMLDKDDAETIETLRDNGYSQVLRHFEKMLRMGKNMGLPAYSMINPDDPDTWTVTADFPDFFPPTDQDISMKLSNWKQSYLSPKRLATNIASLYGIEDPAEIAEMTQEIIDERVALKVEPPVL